MDTADVIALALAGLAVVIGASIAAFVVLRPPARREHPPSTLPAHHAAGDASAPDTVDAPTGGDAPASAPPNRIKDPTPPVLAPVATDATGGGEASAHRDEGVSVAILADEDGNHRWRVTLSSTSDPITVDVFSFRQVRNRISGVAGTNGDLPWRHELLASPMRLDPGHGKSIGGPVDPTVEYTVSIAWVAHHDAGDAEVTRLLHIPVAEIKTWGINGTAVREQRRRE